MTDNPRDDHDKSVERHARPEFVIWDPQIVFTSDPMRGASISWAEIDGVRICLVDGQWCEREYGHDGPHVIASTASDTPPESHPEITRL